MDWKSIAQKKVAGIPVLYLGAAAAVLLAVYAWRMKPSTDTESTEETSTDGVESDVSDPYEGLATQGTVTVVQQATAETESVEQTNDDWLRAAVAYLVEEKKATAGEAQTAINNYLEGNDMTFEQGQLRDAALAKLGLPPERIVTLGSVGTKADAPFQRQFTAFPGKHTVKGSNDNTPWKLASYYGNPKWDNANLIAAANPTLGPPTATYPVGTTITIPSYNSPVWYKTTATTNTFAKVAGKNGANTGALRNLNPNRQEPFPVGTQIRVR